MNNRMTVGAGATLLAMMLAAGCTTTSGGGSGGAPQEWDGLALRDSKVVDKLYARPNVSLKSYTAVMLDPPVVEFDKDWDPNENRRELSRQVTPDDMKDIKEGLAKLLHDGFVAELQRGNYPIATAPAANVLRVSPAIINLYINAPDTMSPGMSRTYVMDAGHMTMFTELRDSATGQLLARAVDTKTGTDFGHLQIANSVTNSAEAKNMISQWAKALRNALDRAKTEIDPVPAAP